MCESVRQKLGHIKVYVKNVGKTFCGIPSLHKHTMSRDDLEIMKTHLREKYCKDIDVLERSTAEDPEAWTKLDEITEELRNLRKLLNATENLVLSSSEDKENLDGIYYYIFIYHSFENSIRWE